MSGIDKYKRKFLEKYNHYVEFANTDDFITLYDFLSANRQKLIWAIEELDSPPIEGVAKSILQLGIDFTVPQTRKITGAMIAVILSDEYIPVSSGRRVSCKPFITSSMYEKKI